MKKLKTVLYVTQPGLWVRHTSERVQVTREKDLLREVRFFDLERVVVHTGGTGITAGAAAALMEAGIDVAFLSSLGAYRGCLVPARSSGVAVRLAQYRAFSDPAQCLPLARALVARKIRNGIRLLTRRGGDDGKEEATEPAARLSSEQQRRILLENAARAAQTAPDLSTLLGCEGTAAAAYFRGLGQRLGGGFSFTERSRRPPRDPANALLSYGYTLLAAEAATACAGAGLDIALGALHQPDAGRPALALDLMEPFRPAVVDRLVLRIANRRELLPERDFLPGSDATGPRLTPDARRRFLVAYEARMTEPFHHRAGAEIGVSGSQTCLREALRRDARHLARALQEKRRFVPFSLP